MKLAAPATKCALVRPTISVAFARGSCRRNPLKPFGLPDDRAKRGGSEKVISNAMTFRKAWLAGEVQLWVERVNCIEESSIRQIKEPPSRKFVKEPSAPLGGASRRLPNESRNNGWVYSIKEPL